MKTRKRTWLKTFLLMLIRYDRWRMNPKNIDLVVYLEQMKPKI